MKTRNLALVIAGLVIAAGCAMQVKDGLVDPQTRYIVKFDQPALLIDRAKFIAALEKASWRRGITFTPKESTDPTPDRDKNPISSAFTETVLISQTSTVNPDSQHVTQRVGFNAGQRNDVDALLEQVSK